MGGTAWRRVMRAGLGLATIALTGCVTGGRRERPRLPADTSPLFKACAPADGGVVATVREGAARVGSGELDWIAEPGRFMAEITGPLGDTLLALKLESDGGLVEVDGGLASQVPRVRVLASGYLEVDGHFVGLKAAELPCVFQAALPPAWTDLLVNVQRRGGELELSFDGGEREMTVTVPGRSSYAYCVRVEWPLYLVMHRRLTWCVGPKERADRGLLDGLGDYSLEWKALTEEGS